MPDLFGFQYRKVLKAEWNGRSFLVHYEYKNGERKINLTDYCRSYCHEHGRNFDKDIRNQLLAIVPDELYIWILPEPRYVQNHPFNTDGSYYLRTKIDEEDLIEKWLSKIIF